MTNVTNYFMKQSLINLVGGPLNGQQRVVQGTLFQSRLECDGPWHTYVRNGKPLVFTYLGELGVCVDADEAKTKANLQ